MALVFPTRPKRRPTGRPRTGRWIVFTLLLAAGLAVAGYYLSLPNFGRPGTPIPPDDPARRDLIAMAHTTDSTVLAQIRGRRFERIRRGCSTAAPARIRALLDSFPTWSDDMLATVACRRIRASMTDRQLRASWGPPSEIIPVMLGPGAIEHWRYGDSVSVLIWDGWVKSWQ